MNRKTQLLGIDVGTSGLKAVLLDSAGALVDEAGIPYGTATPSPGWTEQDPNDWWEALRLALRTLWERGADPRTVAAIGLTGQMHSLVLTGRDGTSRCPSILWSDGRTLAECRAITRLVGEDRLTSLTGNRALAGFTAPKILWVRRHWPEALAGATHLFLPKDAVRFRMSGVAATDMSDASGTLLFDTGRRSWSLELAQELGVDSALLPPCFEGTDIVARVSAEAGAVLGLVPGTPIVAGGGDNAAAAVGLGAVDPGVLTLSIGTSGVVLAPLERYPGRPDGTVQVHLATSTHLHRGRDQVEGAQVCSLT
jgi:xylulokinase